MSQEIYFSLRTSPGSMTSTTIAKSMTGMPAGMRLESWMDRLEKSGGRKSSMTF